MKFASYATRISNTILKFTALAAHSSTAVCFALQQENDPKKLQKLCLVARNLSDQQKSEVLLNKIQAYRWIRKYNINHTFRVLMAAQGQTPSQRFHTDLLPQIMEDTLCNNIEVLLNHKLYPVEDTNQKMVLQELTTDCAGSQSKDNPHFQELITTIPWHPSVATELAHQALKGFHLYNLDGLFTAPLSTSFFTTHFEKLNWGAAGKTHLQSSILWHDAICVLPIDLAQKLLRLHPQIATDPEFLTKVVFREHNLQDLLKTACACGLPLDAVRLKIHSRLFIAPHAARQNCIEFVEQMETAQQKQTLLDNIAPVNCSPTRRKM